MPSQQTTKRKVLDKRFTILLTSQIILVLGLGVLLTSTWNRRSDTAAQSYREVANQLQAVGLTSQAIENYERYLQKASISNRDRATIAFSLGDLTESTGQLGKALGWYYLALELDPQSQYKDDVSTKTVSLLERLGKVEASKRMLKKATSLDKDKQDPSGSVVLATVGDHKIYLHDLEEAIDLLPPAIAKQFASKEKKVDLLHKLVADEVLAQKALRLNVDQTPEFTKKLSRLRKQLLVEDMLQKEIAPQTMIDPTDLENYFKANKEKYANKKGEKAPAFDTVKDRVLFDYQQEKAQTRYQQLIQESLKGDQVTLHPDKIK